MIGLLQVVKGADLGRSAAVGSGSMAIGRGPEAGLRLQDPSVSRVHCKIALVNGNAQLTDAGSSSGTHVNGTSIHQRELQDGDLIRIGDTEIQFRWSNLDEAPTTGWHDAMPPVNPGS